MTKGIEFVLWDDKKLEKKMTEFVEKDLSLFDIFAKVLQPYNKAVKDYLKTVTEQDLQNNGERYTRYTSESGTRKRQDYIDETLRPYFDSVGLQDVKIVIIEEETGKGRRGIRFEHKGYSAIMDDHHGGPFEYIFYPNANYFHGKLVYEFKYKTGYTLGAIAGYVKEMPNISQKTDEMVVKVMRLYDQLMMQHDKQYRANVEFLAPLVTQYAGTPVGKLLKYMRWEAGRLSPNWGIILTSIKVLSDRSFSYLETLFPRKDGKTELREGWLEPDGQIVYAADPLTTDGEEWEKSHRDEDGFTTIRWSKDLSLFLMGLDVRNVYVERLLAPEFFDKNL